MIEYDYTFKVCVFADKDVGKKTLTGFLKKVGSDLNVESIIGVDLFSKNIEIKGKKVSLQLWIFSDKEDAREKDHFFIKGSNGVILMYDIANSRSLDFVSNSIQIIRNEIKYYIPILLVGNKLDLEEYREISKEQLEKFKEENYISESIEFSLETRENVENMFRKFIEMLLEN
jgi:Ras-related protein Rab-1A